MSTEAVTAAFVSNLGVSTVIAGAPYYTGSVVEPGLGESFTLNATSTPAVSKKACNALALTTGAATIDLTSMPGKNPDETVNGTGLKPQLIKFRNKSTNANKMVVSQGASNPVLIDGVTTTWSIPLAPGQSVTLSLDGAATTVGSGAKIIAIAGTGSQVFEYEIVMG